MSPVRVLQPPFRRVVGAPTEQPTFIQPGPDIQQAQSGVSQLAGTPGGIIPLQFGRHNLAGSLTDSKLWRLFPGLVADTHQLPVLMPFQGSVVGVSVMSSAQKTNGQVILKVFKNDALLQAGGETAQYTWPHTQYGYQLWPGGTLWFSAGDRLDIRVSTSSALTPNNSMDIEVMLLVIQTEEL